MSRKAPLVGVFDSGFGGLTVLKELLRQSPGADYLYFGDTARLPYGSKSADTVARYTLASALFLAQQGAEILVIACNTASALALQQVAAQVPLPVVGVIEPGAERAATATRSRQVLVLGTEATVASHAYRRALERHGVAAHEKACPLLVPLVEEGWTEHQVTEQVAGIYLNEAMRDNGAADVLLLGCTHYPLLKPLLRRLAPPAMAVVDSAESTATAVSRMVSAPENGTGGNIRFFATDSVEKFQRLGARFLSRSIGLVELVDIDAAHHSLPLH